MSIRILHGDCREVLKTLPDCSVASIVTDPPYELGFMGKKWDGSGIAHNVGMWAECLRVLKPGGYLLAFSGTRTQHRMVCAIEDAGFEIRDLIAWVYGSGFPKSLDVSKAIDKAAGAERDVIGYRKNLCRTVNRHDSAAFNGTQEGGMFRPDRDVFADTAPATDAARRWQGWGTALKPALEPITMARKPLIGTVAENVLQHGTGAINVDGCRVPTEEGGRPLREVAALRDDIEYHGNALAGRVDGSLASSKAVGSTDAGRWPANLIHDGSEEVLSAFPDTAAGGNISNRSSPKTAGIYGAMSGEGERWSGYSDAGSAARFFYCAKADRADRNEGLRDPGPQFKMGRLPHDGEKVNAARKGNHHPTVKPTELMRYLCRLVTPPGGTVLDPFMGSGSTLKAAELEGFSAIGIELDADYIAIAQRRIAADAPLFAEVTA